MAYCFQCPRDDCSFLLRSDTDREIESLARAHTRVAHRSRIAPADLERRLERVDTT